MSAWRKITRASLPVTNVAVMVKCVDSIKRPLRYCGSWWTLSGQPYAAPQVMEWRKLTPVEESAEVLKATNDFRDAHELFRQRLAYITGTA